MRDLAATLLDRFWNGRAGIVFGLLCSVLTFNLVAIVTPQTVAHMRSKYDAQYDSYAEDTPYLFLLGII